MQMNYTSIEQSQKLVELGLNSNTADFRYIGSSEFDIAAQDFFVDYDPIPVVATQYNNGEYVLPCWSIGELLELMPTINKDGCLLTVQLNKGLSCYWLSYPQLEIDDEVIEAETPIEACYNMIVWLLKNGYIK